MRAGDWSQTPGACSPDDRAVYPAVQWFDGEGFADLSSTSLYRGLDSGIRDRLLDRSPSASHADGRPASRRYLSVLRVGQRTE